MPILESNDAKVSEAELRADIEDIFGRFLADVAERKRLKMEEGRPAPQNVTLKTMSAATLHNALIVASRELTEKIIERVLNGTR